MSLTSEIVINNEIPAGSINGSNKTFLISHLADPEASLEIFLNGVFQVLDIDYTISGDTLTFITAPFKKSILKVNYRYVDADRLYVSISEIVGAGLLAEKNTVDTSDIDDDAITEVKIINDAVTLDKVTFDRFIFSTQFESIDGWSKSAGVTLTSFCQALLDTSSTINTRRYFYVDSSNLNDEMGAPADSPEFQTIIKLSHITSQIATWGHGEYGAGGSDWGFKVIDGTLYAFHTDDTDTEYTQEITGITLTDWNTYRAVFVSGASIKFYINSVLKHTVTTNLPTLGNTPLWYEIKNTSASVRQLGIQSAIYIQDFFH